MASLYRKWRPQTFKDVAGQEHIKKTLQNALQQNRLTHAYLFTGPRGTGKTTIARLLAKALNCEGQKIGGKKQGWKGEPCNECWSCKDITGGQSLDVIEIDAASNRGIEEIRELREKVKFAPGKSSYKIFIIDEVHMLTKEAFNALLKTLEEPPAHAIFILATTEAHKVPQTILSRCQRYDFRRAKKEEIVERLREVVKGEGIKIADDALHLLGDLADGSFRDALSLLDQIAALAGEDELGAGDLQRILGMADKAVPLALLGLMNEGDVNQAVSQISALVEEGTDLENFNDKTIGVIRNLLLIKSGGDKAIVDASLTEEEWGQWQGLGEKFEKKELLDLMRDLIAAKREIKNAPLAQMPLEMAVMQWCQSYRAEAKKDKEEAPVMQDIRKVNEASQAPAAVDAVSSTEEKKEDLTARPLNDETWLMALEKIKPHNHSLYALMKDIAPLGVEGDKVMLGARFRFHAERLYDKKNRPIIEKVLSEILGSPCHIECKIDENMPKPQPVVEDELLKSAVEVFGMEE